MSVRLVSSVAGKEWVAMRSVHRGRYVQQRTKCNNPRRDSTATLSVSSIDGRIFEGRLRSQSNRLAYWHPKQQQQQMDGRDDRLNAMYGRRVENNKDNKKSIQLFQQGKKGLRKRSGCR